MAVGDIRVFLGERVLVAEVRTKEEAADMFKDAVDSGFYALKAEYHSSTKDLFEVSMGNINPGQIVRVEISIFKRVDVVAGKYEFNLPQRYTERYSPDGDTIFSSPNSYEWNFEMVVISSEKILSLTSSTYPSEITIFEGSDGVKIWTAVLENQETLLPNDDLKFRYETSKITVPTLMCQFSDVFYDEIAMVFSFIPNLDLESTNPSQPQEYIIVMDRSGSMVGTPMVDTRIAVIDLLNQLPEGSLFNVYSFGSDYESLFGSSQTLDERDWAIDVIKGFEATLGGTEMMAVFEDILSSNTPEGYQRVIFFLTDGAVTNHKEIVDYVSNTIGDSRLFSFGIGAGTARYLISTLAEVANGMAYFMNSTSELDDILLDALAKAQENDKSNISIEYEVPEDVLFSSHPKALFDNQPFVITALFDKTWTSDWINVTIGSIDHTITIDLTSITVVDVTDKGGELFKVVAHDIINDLQHSEDLGAVIPLIIDISKKYGVPSDYTSFLIIDDPTVDLQPDWSLEEINSSNPPNQPTGGRGGGNGSSPQPNSNSSDGSNGGYAATAMGSGETVTGFSLGW
eukprot:CAMPEP_0115024884 /NCGR_PEP_ID=MMETSP0216-20121206/33582_1 /TAXON_ID=223996 /ORGANISM="Protocruzia adherens, Strain Boccale" /LENGTH=570 /DNA_ID=CAMNT_0002399185 /DNA_START=332 /DNA_END=2041 /DNA_ORIENTATION=+